MDDERSPNDIEDGDGDDAAPSVGDATAAYDFGTELPGEVRLLGPDDEPRATAAPPPSGTDPGDEPGDDAAGGGDERGDEGDRPSLRFPLDESVDPSDVQESLASRPSTGSDASSLPHWTEPATGQNPVFNPGGDMNEDDEDLEAWSGLRPSPPAWRGEGDEWQPEDDVAYLADDSVRVGALADETADPYSFDDAGGSPPAAPPPRRRSTRRVSERVSSGAGRDLPQAVIVGLGLAVALLVLAAIGPGALMVLITPIVVLAGFELFTGLQRVGYRPATLLGAVAVGGMVLGAFWRGEAAIPLVLFLTVAATLVWHLIGVETENVTINSAVTLLGVAWIGVLASFAALILKLPHGVSILVALVLVTVASDIGAYAIGRQFGRTPLARAVSPNKTVEGTVGGGVVAIATAIIVVYWIPGLTPFENSLGDAFWLGVVVAVAGPLGDLCESLVKRDLGIKDMGQILPGHGGVLDRFDAMLFVLPSVYYLTRYLEIF